MKKVLVTGMSGLIGGAVRQRLEGRYDLTALNRRDVPGVRTVQADIADLAAIEPAFVGQDVVVHLAAVVSGDAGWDDVLHYNVIGAYNVFEAARRGGRGAGALCQQRHGHGRVRSPVPLQRPARRAL